MKKTLSVRRNAIWKRRARRRRLLRQSAAIQAAVRAAREIGHADGYRNGYPKGHHRGWCDALLSWHASQVYPVRDAHLLYVTTGMGVPYAPIDEAVVDALGRMVTRVTVCRPTDNIPEVVWQEKPHGMLVLNGMNLEASKVLKVKEMGVRTAVWMTDDPYYTDVTGLFAVHYDHVFTLELSCVPFYRDMGCQSVHYLPFANDFRVYRPREADPAKRCDILFIGSGYWNRIQFFDAIAPYLATKNVLITGWWWDRLANFHLLADKIRLGQWMTPAETAEYYAGAKIVINLHRSHDDDSYNRNTRRIPAHSVNPRTFEIAGSGALQLTDVRLDLQNHYVPGREIVTYGSPEELIAKIEYYLAREDERMAIVKSGLKRTLKHHTYEKRLEALLNVMFS
jgi:spore maturation protein CgeB